MLLGRVVGEVWATRKDPRVENMKFLVVRQIGLDRQSTSSFVVAVDTVGAGPGELVMVAQGSSARQSEQTTNRPVDAVIMAILDDLAVEERDWQAFDRKEARR